MGGLKPAFDFSRLVIIGEHEFDGTKSSGPRRRETLEERNFVKLKSEIG